MKGIRNAMLGVCLSLRRRKIGRHLALDTRRTILRSGMLIFMLHGISEAFGFPMFGAQKGDGKTPVTVQTAIELVRLADHAYFSGASSKGRVAIFSHDAKRFVVLLRRGDLKRNTNEYLLYLFDTENLAREAKPILIMASSSNREAIHDLKWLDDNETIAFVGENPAQQAQVYTLDIRTGKLTNRTEHKTSVTSFDISRDGRVLLFSAELPSVREELATAPGEPLVISGQSLSQLLSGQGSDSRKRQLFVKRGDSEAIEVPMTDDLLDRSPIRISPDGSYGLVGAYANQYPADWSGYEDEYLEKLLSAKGQRTEVSYLRLKRYWLVDLVRRTLVPAIDTPMATFASVIWSTDSRWVFLASVRIPFGAETGREREARRKRTFDVEVKVPSREWRICPVNEWPESPDTKPDIKVELQEEINSPPKIYASRGRIQGSRLILDLNADLSGVELGRVETIEWSVHGVVLLGGLYLPPDYQAGKRYPLILQTHGYDPERFAMDGRNEWSSGFAARVLAAKGFLILQTYTFKDPTDHDRVGADRSLGSTEEQSFKHFNVLAYEEAITHLDRLGRIDPERVGISGFSRTVCYVAYLLTHTKTRFAAATMTDGIDCGYFDYLSFPSASWDMERLNGGGSPLTEEGMGKWLEEAPAFRLARVQTPVRLVALGSDSIVHQWEWYIGLTLLGKPVDFVEIPNAVHLLEKPLDRRIADEGIVDWFCFWLLGEEDSDKRKTEQYERWRELRNAQPASAR